MSQNQDDLVTRVRTDTSGYDMSGPVKQLRELNRALIENQQKQKDVNKTLNDSQKELRALEEEVKRSGTQTEEQKRRMNELTASIERDRLQLAQLRTEQAQLRGQISDTTKQLRDQSGELKELKDALSKVSDAGRELATEIAAVGAAAVAAAAAVFAFVNDAAAWADDMNTLSQKTGLSTDTLQKFAYASELIDVDVSTMTGSLTKLNKAMASAASGSGAAFEAFQKLDVAATDSGGLRDREEVFNELITALGKMENETERNALALTLFGKSAEQLNPLIKGGADQLKRLGDEAEAAGLILSQDALDGLHAFHDNVDLLKADANQLLKLIAADMQPAVEDLALVGETLLTELMELHQSGELKKWATEAGIAVGNAAAALKNLIGFVEKHKAAIAGAAAAMAAFKIGLSIGSLISALITAFSALKAATEAETVSQLALNAAMDANPIGLVIGLVGALAGGLSALAIMSGTTATAMDDFSHSLQQIETRADNTIARTQAGIKVIEQLRDEYDRLRTSTDLNAAEQKKLDTIAEQLAEKLGMQVSDLRTAAGAYRDLSLEIENVTQKMLAKAKAAAMETALEEAYQAQAEAKRAMHEAIVKNEEVIARVGASPDLWHQGEFDAAQAAVEQAQKAVSAAADTVVYYESELSAATGELSAFSNASDAAATSTAAAETAVTTATDAAEELSKALKTAKSSYDLLQKAEKSVADSGKISSDVLQTMIDKFPALQEVAGEYIQGRKTEQEVLEALKKQYEEDEDAFAKAQRQKLSDSETLYSDMLKTSSDWAKKVKDTYQVDVQNFTSATAAKVAVSARAAERLRELQEQLNKFNSGIYSTGMVNGKEYLVRHNKLTGEDELIAEGSAEYKAWKETQQRYRDAYHSATSVDSLFDELLTGYSSGDSLSGLFDASGSSGSSKKTEKSALQKYLDFLNAKKELGQLSLRKELASLEYALQQYNATEEEKHKIDVRMYQIRQQLAAEEEKQRQERLSAAAAAYSALVDGEIKKLEELSKAQEKSVNEQVAALDKLLQKRKELQNDQKRQQEIQKIDAQLRYQQLDELSAYELRRRRQELLNEQAEVDFERNIAGQKAALSDQYAADRQRTDEAVARLQAANNTAAYYYAQQAGTLSTQQIVTNNNQRQNVTLVQNGTSDQQMLDRLLRALYTGV